MEGEAYNPSVSPTKGGPGEILKVPAPISSSYVAKGPTDIIIDRKVLSGGKYTISESGGAVLFNVKGTTFNLFQTKRVLLDASGTPLVCMKHKFAGMYSKWLVYRGDLEDDQSDANLLFTMKKSSLFQFNPSLEIRLTGKSNSKDNSETPPDFEVKGNFNRHKFKIFHGETVVAEANKKINAASIFLCKGQYAIAIYPGVDQAFIASIIVILDEMNRCTGHAATGAGGTS